MGYEYKQHENQYINPLANQPFEMGPTRKLDKGYIKADKMGTLGQMGFNRMFDEQIAKRNMEIDAQYDPYSNLGNQEAGGNYGQLYRDRLKQMNTEEGNRGRYAYAQGMVNNSAQRLMDMWMRKNAQQSQNLASAAGFENDRYNLVKTGFDWNSFANSLVGGAASVGSAFAGCDERFKENIEPYDNGLADISKLAVVEFDYNGVGGTIPGHHTLGVIAQHSPEVAVPLGNGYQGVDAQKLLFMAINAIQTLEKEVKDLRAQLEDR